MPPSRARVASVGGRERGGLGPSPHRHPPVPRVHTDRQQLAGYLRRHRGQEPRVHRRRGTDHDAIDSELDPASHPLERPVPAADLDSHPAAHPLEDPPHRRLVVPLVEGAVQVHDVNPARTLVGESFGDGGRVRPINGLPRRLALAQADDAAVSNVDGGKELH